MEHELLENYIAKMKEAKNNKEVRNVFLDARASLRAAKLTHLFPELDAEYERVVAANLQVADGVTILV